MTERTSSQEVARLRDCLSHLVKWRREEIDRAKERIRSVNEAFDRAAADYNRQIRELEPEPEPEPKEEPTPQAKPTRKRKTKPLTIEDMQAELERRGKLNGG